MPSQAALSRASDAELLLTLKEAVRRADWKDRNSVITELYHRYAANLATTWLRRTGDLDLTQEVLQETFARATSKLASLPPGRSILIWLRTTARNYFFDRLRHEGVRAQTAETRVEIGCGHNSEETLVSQMDRARAETFVAQYVRQLEPTEREVIRLRLAGCALGEVCTRLGISEQAGRRLYARIRFVLQKMRLRGLPLFSSDLLMPLGVQREDERTSE